MVDDPSEHPELFPTADEQQRERERLFQITRELVNWESTTSGATLDKAREEIWKHWRLNCDANANHPDAKALFNRDRLPIFYDPFAGGGSLPLEAQRLGLEACASDLNPVAVLINKAMIEIPPRFAGLPPVNPDARAEKELLQRPWRGSQGLAADVKFYADWMRDEASKRIGNLYPEIEITASMVAERPDLQQIIGEKITVVAWLWARTVKSPNPAFAEVDVPLASSFMLSTKEGDEAYVEPIISSNNYRFAVRKGKPKDYERAKNGTKVARGSFQCLMSRVPISLDYIRAEGTAGRMGARMMGIVAQSSQGRVYLAPTDEMEAVASAAVPKWVPNTETYGRCRINVGLYGMTTWDKLFTNRQLVALEVFSALVLEAREKVLKDAIDAGLATKVEVQSGGLSAPAYADAIAVYLALCSDRLADRNSSLCGWDLAQAARGREATVRNVFARQALPMVWDFAEVNILADTAGSFDSAARAVVRVIERIDTKIPGTAAQADATSASPEAAVVSTDPPYYDNISYADLSDFFYVWLRHSLKPILPDLFSTVGVPKSEELVAASHRHGGKRQAEVFFLSGMVHAMRRIAASSHPAFPVTIYYAFKQSETDGTSGTVSTGWETFLDAVIRAGFAVTGTWPVRTELSNRMIGSGSNALASSIVLVCRSKALDAPTVTRRELLAQLKIELPNSLRHLQHENIAPVDLAQAAIGPGMEVFTRFSKVLDAEGRQLGVRDALALINDVLDEILAEQEGDFDAESRFAISWFDQSGFADGEFGAADVLARAKNTSVNRLTDAGIAVSRGGKFRLLRPVELSPNWDPHSVTLAWDIVHRAIGALESSGEDAAASLITAIGARGAVVRELAYRLYAIAERRKRAAEALSYNGLVQSWPEIARLAHNVSPTEPVQTDLLGAI